MRAAKPRMFLKVRKPNPLAFKLVRIRKSGPVYLVTLWVSILCISLVYTSSVKAQENYGVKPGEVMRIPWGTGPGKVGLFKTPERNYGPQSFAINELTKKIYILDSVNSRILVYNEENGNFARSIPLKKPRGDDIALEDEKSIYVLYLAEEKVIQYSLEGQILHSYEIPDFKDMRPVSGIYFVEGKGLFFQTSDQKLFPLFSFENGGKMELRSEQIHEKASVGLLLKNLKSAFVKRESGNMASVTINNLKEITIHRHEHDICGLYVIGNDDAGNIYLIVEELLSSNPIQVRRYLMKYSEDRNLLADTQCPYNNYAYIFREFRVTSNGIVYQMIPFSDYLEIIKWVPEDQRSTGAISIEELANKAQESALESKFQNLMEAETLEAKSLQALPLPKISRDEVMARAYAYASHSFYVGWGNITAGDDCGGKIVKTCSDSEGVCSPGTYTGVRYKWGGFSGLEGVSCNTDCSSIFFDKGLEAGKYAGDMCTAYDPDCAGIWYGSCCAVGVDCSGFVSQCWGLREKYSSSSLTTISSPLSNLSDLLRGDMLRKSGHVMLCDSNYPSSSTGIDVYEASGWDWKVSHRHYYWSSISDAYSPYRYEKIQNYWTRSTKFNVGDSVVTTDYLNLRIGPGACFNKVEGITNPLPPGTEGQIINDDYNRNGIYIYSDTNDGSHYYWWHVKVGNYTGWCAENWLEKSGETLSVSLTASPSNGNAPLDVQLTADVSGTATGTINYTFWWNCNDPGTSVGDVMNVCGYIPTPSPGSCASNENGIKCDGVTNDPKIVSHTYSSPGTYTAKVIAERGSADPAEDRITITVNSPLPPSPTNVQASDGTYTDKVRVTWNSVSSATSYKVYRATSSGGTKTYLGSTSSTTYDDYSASVGTTYYYWVKAKNAYGESGYSSYDTGYRKGTSTHKPMPWLHLLLGE